MSLLNDIYTNILNMNLGDIKDFKITPKKWLWVERLSLENWCVELHQTNNNGGDTLVKNIDLNELITTNN